MTNEPLPSVSLWKLLAPLNAFGSVAAFAFCVKTTPKIPLFN